MALSGSFDYTVTAADVIQSALEKVRVVIAGESVDSDDQALALRELNKLVKQWSSPGDNSPGMKAWLRKIIYLFLEYGEREYFIGPSAVSGADRAVLSYSDTTISAAEAAGQTTLSVTSTTGMTASDVIGIVLDSGAIQWTTISSTGAGPTVVVADALTGAAAAGNAVFWFTPGTARVQFRPIEILTCLLRDTSDYDQPVSVYTREQFERFEIDFANKASDRADPVEMVYEVQRQLTKITLDYGAENTDKVLRMVVLSPADDLDATTDDLAFPPEWFSALEWELAKRLCTPFGYQFTPQDNENWTQATMIARNINPRGFIGGYHSEDGDEDEGTL